MPGAKIAKDVRDLPDAILIRDQNVILAPGEPIGLVESFGIALDELGFAVALLSSEQRQVTRLLFGYDDVAIGQHEQPARMFELRKQRRGKAVGNLG